MVESTTFIALVQLTVETMFSSPMYSIFKRSPPPVQDKPATIADQVKDSEHKIDLSILLDSFKVKLNAAQGK